MKTESEFWKEYSEQENEYQSKIDKSWADIIVPLGYVAIKEAIEILDGARITAPLSIVSKPSGHDQDFQGEFFKGEFVDQWSVGDSGDSFEGSIYLKINSTKWIRIPYDC